MAVVVVVGATAKEQELAHLDQQQTAEELAAVTQELHLHLLLLSHQHQVLQTLEAEAEAVELPTVEPFPQQQELVDQVDPE
jgi:hypothetical protein